MRSSRRTGSHVNDSDECRWRPVRLSSVALVSGSAAFAVSALMSSPAAAASKPEPPPLLVLGPATVGIGGSTIVSVDVKDVLSVEVALPESSKVTVPTLVPNPIVVLPAPSTPEPSPPSTPEPSPPPTPTAPPTTEPNVDPVPQDSEERPAAQTPSPTTSTTVAGHAEVVEPPLAGHGIREPERSRPAPSDDLALDATVTEFAEAVPGLDDGEVAAPVVAPRSVAADPDPAGVGLVVAALAAGLAILADAFALARWGRPLLRRAR